MAASAKVGRAGVSNGTEASRGTASRICEITDYTRRSLDTLIPCISHRRVSLDSRPILFKIEKKNKIIYLKLLNVNKKHTGNMRGTNVCEGRSDCRNKSSRLTKPCCWIFKKCVSPSHTHKTNGLKIK